MDIGRGHWISQAGDYGTVEGTYGTSVLGIGYEPHDVSYFQALNTLNEVWLGPRGPWWQLHASLTRHRMVTQML